MAVFTLSALEKTLLELFGLTPAEARVASLLSDGKSSREIKLILKIGTKTLKFHLEHIFQKTGTSHRGQLIVLLLVPRRRAWQRLAAAPGGGPKTPRAGRSAASQWTATSGALSGLPSIWE